MKRGRVHTQSHFLLRYALPVAFLFHAVNAQVIIETADIQNLWKANSPIRIYADTSTYVNVGYTGGPNVYDFSSLGFSDSSNYTLYPTAQIAFLATRFSPSCLVWGPSTDTLNSSIFFFTDTSFNQLADVVIYPDSQSCLYEMKPLLEFPATYGLQWNHSDNNIVDSVFVNNALQSTSTQTSTPQSYDIDGYGTLVFKGQSYQCLRVKETSPSVTKYSYFTKNGPTIIIDGSQSQIDTGLVPIKQIGCIAHPGIATLVQAQSFTPNTFSLAQNYPNPFNPSTNISYTVGSHQFVSLQVYDVLGRKVAMLVNEAKDAGTYSVRFDASHLTSGVYLYRLQAGNFSETKKLLLMK